MKINRVALAHLREIRTAADSVIPGPFNFDNNNNYFGQQQAFQAPAFAFAGQIPEQPFQHQLPQLTPLPSFESNAYAPENEAFAPEMSGPSFHSYPAQSHNNMFENAPAMINNEPMTSAFLYNGNGQVNSRRSKGKNVN